MSKSFQIDLGNGRRLTWPGRLVVLLAVAASLGSGGACLYGLEGRGRLFDPSQSLVLAVAAGLVALGVGRVALLAARIPFSRTSTG